MRLIQRSALALSALVLCGAVAPASSLGGSTGGSSLEAALTTVSADDIRADLHFIAADELGGRDTPSVGLRVAARFLRARLLRLGWQPGAGDSYFYEYPLELRRIDPDASSAALVRGEERTELRWGRDYFFKSRGMGLVEIDAELLFCGYGSASEFEGIKARGRWALCFEGDVHWRARERAARLAGAKGVLVIPGPGYDDEAYAVRFQRDTERAMSANPRAKRNEEAGEPVFPHTYLTGDVAAAALGDLTVNPPELGTRLGVNFVEDRALVGETGEVTLENVCGFWPGSDPYLSKEVIIVSAHYDHVGQRPNGDIYNGADDNGSGTCGLLAIAEMLSEYGPLRRSVMLMWVSGEEKGLLGSEAWAKDPLLPKGHVAVCDINIDMIGRNAPDYLLVTPTKARKEYNGLVRLAESLAPSEGFPELGSCDEYWSRSDHMNFAKHMDLPVMFLFSDVHADYHKPTDTVEKIDYDKIVRVSRLVVRMLAGLQDDELDL